MAQTMQLWMWYLFGNNCNGLVKLHDVTKKQFLSRQNLLKILSELNVIGLGNNLTMLFVSCG